MSANNRTQLRAWEYLYANGAATPREISAGIRRSKQGTYQALHSLLTKGKVCRTGRSTAARYTAAPGSTPPDCMRGLTLGSKLALERNILRARRPFAPCELAQCWR